MPSQSFKQYQAHPEKGWAVTCTEVIFYRDACRPKLFLAAATVTRRTRIGGANREPFADAAMIIDDLAVYVWGKPFFINKCKPVNLFCQVFLLINGLFQSQPEAGPASSDTANIKADGKVLLLFMFKDLLKLPHCFFCNRNHAQSPFLPLSTVQDSIRLNMLNSSLYLKIYPPGMLNIILRRGI